MSLPKKIVELLTAEPNLTGVQIAEKTQADARYVRIALWKMAKSGKLAREKQLAEGKKRGPQNEYVYKVV
jgi:predicted transcriptional regulator